jgi:HPt (histidine-containing phosphotransfer) domain-containing protein
MIGISTGPSKVSPPSPLPGDAPIDLDHLSRMTLGERGLEREVLELFERQAKMLLARMRSAALPVVAAQAHTLKGSARSIGAWRVARAAETVEQASSDEIAAALAALDAAVAEARAAIAGLLRSH